MKGRACWHVSSSDKPFMLDRPAKRGRLIDFKSQSESLRHSQQIIPFWVGAYQWMTLCAGRWLWYGESPYWRSPRGVFCVFHLQLLKYDESLVNQIRQGGLNWSYCKSSSSIFCSESEIEVNFSEAGLVNQIGQPLSTDRIVCGLSHCSNCQHSFKTSQRWCILGRAIVFKPTAARYVVGRFPTQSYWAFHLF